MWSGTAFSATIHVPGDQATIQVAIDAAVDGDRILVAPGTYVENIDFLGKAISACSESGAASTVIDGNQAGSGVLFSGDEDEETVLDGFTVTNGTGSFDPYGYLAGGGIYCFFSSPTITSCIVAGNSADYLGCGIACWSASPTITDCTISDNSIATIGGGIGCLYASPTITDCTISGNEADWIGGGIGSLHSTLSITNCVISENTVVYEEWDEAFGGGIGCMFDSAATISGCTITGNNALSGGGICGHTDTTIRNCEISANTAGAGGGINVLGGGAIEDCTIQGNVADAYGGGIQYSFSSSFFDPRITSCTIQGNTAGTHGGGISCTGGSYLQPRISNCSITENTAQSGGGVSCANYSGSYSYAALSNCLVSGNTAGDGGGIFGDHGHMWIANCLVYENSASHDGGGMCFSDTGNISVTNCTIAENGAENNGGGVYNVSLLVIKNSIFWGNFASQGDDEIQGYAEVTYSDVQGGWEGTGNLDADPIFLEEVPFHLDPASPCIDAGDPDSAYDDACFPPSLGTEQNDMGAYGGPDACGWCTDNDGDGVSVCDGDCDDEDPLVHPEAEEVCDNGIDDDCDGLVDYDDEECPIFEAFTTCLTTVVHPGDYAQVNVEIHNLTPEQQHFDAYLRLTRCNGSEKPWRSGHRTIGPDRWFRTTLYAAVPENTPNSYKDCDLAWHLVVNDYSTQAFQAEDACTWQIQDPPTAP